MAGAKTLSKDLMIAPGRGISAIEKELFPFLSALTRAVKKVGPDKIDGGAFQYWTEIVSDILRGKERTINGRKI